MKKFFVLTIAALFIIPLSSVLRIAGTHVWHNHFVIFFLFLNLGVSLYLWRFNKWLSVMSALFLFSSYVIAPFDSRAIFCLLTFNLSCLTAYVISLFTKRQRKIIMWCVVAMVVIQGAWVVLQANNLDPVFNYKNEYHKVFEDRDDTVGSIGSRNMIGTFFATTAPMVASVFPYALLLSVFGLWKATTTFAWAAFIVVALVWVWFIKRKLLLAVVPALIVCSLIFFFKYEAKGVFNTVKSRGDLYRTIIDKTVSGRIDIVRTLKMSNKKINQVKTCNPWFGYGLGQYLLIFPFFDATGLAFDGDTVYSHAHNDYLELFFETGYTGAMVMALLLIGFFIEFFIAKKTKEVVTYFCCILSFLLCAMGLFPTQVAVTAMFFILFYGMFKGAVREQRRLSDGTKRKSWAVAAFT